jgi:hypothetical protein
MDADQIEIGGTYYVHWSSAPPTKCVVQSRRDADGHGPYFRVKWIDSSNSTPNSLVAYQRFHTTLKEAWETTITETQEFVDEQIQNVRDMEEQFKRAMEEQEFNG